MTEPTPTFYAQRRDQIMAEAGAARQRFNQLAWVRLGVFVGGLALIVLAWAYTWWAGLLSVLVFLFGFYRFVQWHQGILRRAVYLEALAEVNERERKALEYDFNAFPTGAEWMDALHPYTLDLDIFGPFSLYQLLVRCTTAVGRERLAQWLLAPATEEVVSTRQEAVAELAGDYKWRQHLLAMGAELNDSLQVRDQLKHWLEEPPLVLGNRGLRTALWGIPIFIALGIVAIALGLPWGAGLLFLVPPGLILQKHAEAIQRIHSYTAFAGNLLKQYGNLMESIEEQSFQSHYLKQLHTTFIQDQKAASSSIRRLGYIISQLDVRYNAFAVLLEFSMLWSLQFIYRLDKWRAAHRELLLDWFDALAELEALQSFANLYFNYPDWSFPILTDQPAIEADALGHPLLPPNKRVTNNLSMPTQGHIHLITGSNMAGKSTWLRTVGINLVLAQAGSPVCARSICLPPLQVYTSMRTQDALHESTSSFYAELKRLKTIIDAVEHPSERPVFFILDEILKGTNSRDRHTGAKALIRQLIRQRAAGLIATHDLELAVMEAETGSQVENWAMEVRIENGQLFFDYQLRPGVSESFNATLLMREMGIRI